MAAIIPKVTKLSSLITRVLGCNPSPMTLQGTNTYLIGQGKRRVLVDAGQSGFPEYLESLSGVLDREECELSDIIITHWHPDHIGGLPELLRRLDYEPKIHKYPRVDAPEPDVGKVYMETLQDGQIFDVEGSNVQVLHTPGHTTDHVALYVKDENVLLSGDCILGEGTAVFEDLHSYMLSLEKILSVSPQFIYPAHGPVVEEPVMKIQYYIQHRLQRESQILDTLTETGDLMHPADIVTIIYKDTPKKLHGAAQINVTQHLKKLVKDGKVEKVGDKWKAVA